MKTLKNILIAFILNFSFAVFEFFGGFLTGSVAIFSDAIHDLGDALSIGISFILEKKSKKPPNNKYTFGYSRFSAIGSLFTTLVLLIGSCYVIIQSIQRIIMPQIIDYKKMIIFAIIGVIVNFFAALFTHKGDSVNQKAVNLHMLEDVFGWLIVLIGAIIMNFTDFSLLDPILSIGVTIFILAATIKNLIYTLDIFLEKTPKNIDIEKLKEHLLEIEGVKDIHHVHVWTLDGINNYSTMHVVTNDNFTLIKNRIKDELKEFNIFHSTLEFESVLEQCNDKECNVETIISPHSHHNN